MAIGIKSFNGLFLNEGVVVSILEDNYVTSGTVGPAGDYSDIKSYSLASNLYSLIRVRVCGDVFGIYSNVTLDGQIEIIIGSTASYPIQFRIPATGAGDYFRIPFAVEFSNIEQSNTTIIVRIWSNVGTFDWRCLHFCVEGII